MPIIFSYDLKEAETRDHNRIQSMFQRFGWERIGGSCYRYPALPRIKESKKQRGKTTANREDWLNAVIPALMCFRAYALRRKLRLTKHSLDAQTSTGSHGAQPRSGKNIEFKTPTSQHFGEAALRKWLDDVTNGIPPNYA